MNYIPINKGQFSLDTPEREADFERRRGHGCEPEYAENRRQWTDFPRRQHVAEFPLHVDLELASVCNLRCPMCYTITDAFKEKVNATLMDYDLFVRLVDQCAAGGVYSIRLSLRGEAFLHKRIVDCIRVAKDKGIREVSTLTNGGRLDEAMFEQVMEAGLDWLTLSIDGMADVYNRVRRPLDFDRMVEKIRNFHEIRLRAGRTKPAIKVQTIFPAIAGDPGRFYATLAPITDLVATNPLIDYLRNDDEAGILYHDNFVCPQLYQRLTIGADGTALLCANDETNDYVVGDATVDTIFAIWHGKRLREARAIHARHGGAAELTPCRHCYLPRQTAPETVDVGGRSLTLEYYLNRSQEIGR